MGGANGIYSGALYQRGQGVGGFLASLFKSVLPILRKRGFAVGKTLLSSGLDMVNDLQNNVTLGNAYRNRKHDTFEKLKSNVLSGEGYNNTRKRKRSQSSTNTRKNNTAKKRKKKSQPKKKAKPNKKKSVKRKLNQIRDLFT